MYIGQRKGLPLQKPLWCLMNDTRKPKWFLSSSCSQTWGMVKQKPSRKTHRSGTHRIRRRRKKISPHFAQNFYSLKFQPLNSAFKYISNYLPCVKHLVWKGISLYKRLCTVTWPAYLYLSLQIHLNDSNMSSQPYN